MSNPKKTTQKFVLKDESGKNLDIPLEGSLGILASGYKGIMLWREKRKEALYQNLVKKMESDNAPKKQ